MSVERWIGNVHEGDALEMLPELPPDSVDLVLTDPPYNISEGEGEMDIHGAGSVVRRDYGEWDRGKLFPHDWVPLCEEVLKEKGAFVSFYDALNIEVLKEAIYDAGFDFVTKYYWVKTNPRPLVRVKTLIPGAEEMFLAVKGGGGSQWFNENLPQRSSCIHAPLVTGREHTEHPTQKPVSVMKKIIEYHCPPDGVVLDPFVGSGTTAVAAEQLGRDWIAFEREPTYVEQSEYRLKNETYYEAGNAMEVEW